MLKMNSIVKSKSSMNQCSSCSYSINFLSFNLVILVFFFFFFFQTFFNLRWQPPFLFLPIVIPFSLSHCVAVLVVISVPTNGATMLAVAAHVSMSLEPTCSTLSNAPTLLSLVAVVPTSNAVAERKVAAAAGCPACSQFSDRLPRQSWSPVAVVVQAQAPNLAVTLSQQPSPAALSAAPAMPLPLAR